MDNNEKATIVQEAISYLDNKIVELDSDNRFKKELHNMLVKKNMSNISKLISVENEQRKRVLDEMYSYAITEIIQKCQKKI